MGLIRSISDAIGGDLGQDDVFTYRCMSCDSEFDMPKTRMIGVRCPNCHSMDVRDATDD